LGLGVSFGYGYAQVALEISWSVSNTTAPVQRSTPERSLNGRYLLSEDNLRRRMYCSDMANFPLGIAA